MRTFLSHQRAAFVALALFAVLGVLTACTVTISVDPALLTRSGGWKFDGFSIGAAPSNQKDLWQGMTAVFTGSGTNGSVTFTPSQAALTASGFPASTKFSGTWTLNDTRTRITFSSSVAILDGELLISELSATTLRMKWTITGNTTETEYKFVGN